MWVVRLEVAALTREAALETLSKAFNDAVKTNYEDANTGPVIWGHMSRQSGLVIEEVPMADLPALGQPQGRILLERRLAQLKSESAEVEALLSMPLDRTGEPPYE